jgi:Flp pilus assembly pilin Flp
MRRGHLTALRSDTRGANLVEYMMLVGLVALVAMVGFRAFGAAALEKVSAQAECVATFNCDPGSPGGTDAPIGTPGVDPSTGPANPPFGNITGATGHTSIEGDVSVVGQGDGTGVHPNDINQGGLGDCYLLSSLGAIALQNRSIIENAVRDNGDGTYTVTFYEPSNAPFWKVWADDYNRVEITVSNELATDENGNPAFARFGDTNELWPMIIEKAYAQWKGGYEQINGGVAGNAMEALTGQESTVVVGDMDLDDMAEAFQDGEAIVLSSMPSADAKGPLYDNGTLVSGHAYFVTNVDEANNRVTIHNPWGWAQGEITLTYQEYVDHFYRYSVNPAED